MMQLRGEASTCWPGSQWVIKRHSQNHIMDYGTRFLHSFKLPTTSHSRYTSSRIHLSGTYVVRPVTMKPNCSLSNVSELFTHMYIILVTVEGWTKARGRSSTRQPSLTKAKGRNTNKTAADADCLGRNSSPQSSSLQVRYYFYI